MTENVQRLTSTIDLVFNCIKRANQRGYIGEPVSQLEHALQAGYFAQQMGADKYVQLAAFLHDIGHLCADPMAPQMEQLGVLNHERIGRQYLAKAGFSEQVCELVGRHVDAKRYLAFKNCTYVKQLSKASEATLAWQGGPMTEGEAAEFEKHPMFNEIICVRRADEAAKKINLKVPGISFYQQLANQLVE